MLETLRSLLGSGTKEKPDESLVARSEASLRRADGGPRRVAVFCDTSNESEYAFRWAVANIIDKERDQCVPWAVGTNVVTLLSVASPAPFTDAPVIGSEVDAPLETPAEAVERSKLELLSAKEKAAHVLDKLAAAGKERGVQHMSTAVIEANSAALAGPLLCEFAVQNSTDVAVLGSHGRTLSRMLLSIVGLGSVSDYCVRSLQCPVTVVKHKPSDLVQATRQARVARQDAEHKALEARRTEQEALRRRQKGL